MYQTLPANNDNDNDNEKSRSHVTVISVLRVVGKMSPSWQKKYRVCIATFII